MEKGLEKMCRIGEKGKKGRETILLDAIVTARRFYSEYFLTMPAKTNVLSSVCKSRSSNSARACQTSRTDLLDANVYKIVEERELCLLVY